MSSIQSVLSTDVIESLRTFLSQATEPFIDLPGTSDTPGICISTSFATFRRHIETEHQQKVTSQPKVPPNYRLGGIRNKLPSSPLSSSLIRKPSRYQDSSTQTSPRLEFSSSLSTSRSRVLKRTSTNSAPAGSESAPESRGSKRRLRYLHPPASSDDSDSSDQASQNKRFRPLLPGSLRRGSRGFFFFHLTLLY